MSIQCNIHEAKTHLSSLLEKVGQGEEVIIAKAGKPIARIVPMESQRLRQPGMYQHLFPEGKVSDRFFDPLESDELEAWDQ